MKTLLNLLPEEKKDAIQSRLRSRFLLWQLFLVFVLEVFYLSILVSSYLILDYQLKSLQSVSESERSDVRTEVTSLNTYEKKFQEVNALISVVERMDHAHLFFSRVFKLLDPLTPPGIIVNQLKTQEFTVSLTGKAAKREDLLLFDKRLKEEGKCIENVDIPVSNLFSQENIDFQLDFSVKQECLKYAENKE